MGKNKVWIWIVAVIALIGLVGGRAAYAETSAGSGSGGIGIGSGGGTTRRIDADTQRIIKEMIVNPAYNNWFAYYIGQYGVESLKQKIFTDSQVHHVTRSGTWDMYEYPLSGFVTNDNTASDDSGFGWDDVGKVLDVVVSIFGSSDDGSGETTTG